MSISVVAHCDWSIDQKKRWMCAALRDGTSWLVSAPELVGDTGDLLTRLKRRGRTGGALLLGFDFPIGLPAAYGKATGLPSFRAALSIFGSGAFDRWFEVAEHADEISLQRPFYPMRPGGTKRQHLFDALCMASGADLLRRCERATAARGDACMLFWTLGGNQVGKAAISGWQEVVLPNLWQLRLWPFDGSLSGLAEGGGTIIAETYPGDAYGQIGMARRPVWSKRQQSGRKAAGAALLRWMDARPQVRGDALTPMIEDGFGPDKAGEDRFDATAGLFAMLDVVDGRRPEGHPDDPDIRTWEGWIFGQAA